MTFVCREVSVLHLMLDKMIALMISEGLLDASDLRISCLQNAFVIILVQFLKPDPNYKFLPLIILANHAIPTCF